MHDSGIGLLMNLPLCIMTGTSTLIFGFLADALSAQPVVVVDPCTACGDDQVCLRVGRFGQRSCMDGTFSHNHSHMTHSHVPTPSHSHITHT